MTHENLKIISLQVVSDLTGIPRRTLYRKVKDGTFPIKRLRGITPMKFSRSEIEAWVKNQ